MLAALGNSLWMKTSKMKVRLTTYFLITMLFVSQSFASNLMPCESLEHSSSQSMQHSGVLQEVSHDMSHDLPDAMAMDCCDQDCACPVGTCASFAVLNSFSQQVAQIHSVKVLLSLSTISDPFQTSLNKPPINS